MGSKPECHSSLPWLHIGGTYLSGRQLCNNHFLQTCCAKGELSRTQLPDPLRTSVHDRHLDWCLKVEPHLGGMLHKIAVRSHQTVCCPGLELYLCLLLCAGPCSLLSSISWILWHAFCYGTPISRDWTRDRPDAGICTLKRPVVLCVAECGLPWTEQGILAALHHNLASGVKCLASQVSSYYCALKPSMPRPRLRSKVAFGFSKLVCSLQIINRQKVRRKK